MVASLGPLVGRFSTGGGYTTRNGSVILNANRMPSTARRIEEREPAPFLKWVGGKRQLLAEILRRVPPGRIRRYAEPFVGGGALFFELFRQDRIKSATLCDTNADLIDTYLAVRDTPEDVIDALQVHKNTAEHYYEVRALDPKKLSLAARAARTIYLNRCGYNGLYRVNLAGKFNVPFGRYANPSIRDPEGLRAASRALQCADLRVADFAVAVSRLKKGDFAYFDPPYVPLSVTSSFTAYTRDGFTLEDQKRLRNTARALKSKGVRVLLSNSSSPVVYDLYRDGFTCSEVAATRMINCVGQGRGRIAELLIR
jgi:DNA adenine methylase